MSTENNNNGLYLIIGVLIAAVIAITFMFSGDDVTQEPNVIERTVERTIEKVPTPAPDADNSADEGSSFSINVDENGVSASSQNN